MRAAPLVFWAVFPRLGCFWCSSREEEEEEKEELSALTLVRSGLKSFARRALSPDRRPASRDVAAPRLPAGLRAAGLLQTLNAAESAWCAAICCSSCPPPSLSLLLRRVLFLFALAPP
ncbi:unnamed protein product [Prorocentrum cordatum]|uniref:Secreted protein n=1 Tax=Prorocentrum cordatum TaxID=2364126 RepID=A0ABN9U9L4_9DINO|nr:unnamed protein product [Polarella glacialis]